MFNSNNGYSLADIAAATGNTNGNGFFGNGDGSWWIVILFLLCFNGGWGNGFGWGGNGANGAAFQGSTTREEVAYGFDVNNIENGLRSISESLSDRYCTLDTNLLTGIDRVIESGNQNFAGLTNTMIQSTANLQQGIDNIRLADIQNTNAIQQAIQANTVAGMQNTNALTAQLTNLATTQASCCCETQRQIERGFADAAYNSAMQSAQTNQAICDSTRDIIDNQNAGVRSILDFLTQDKIATLQAENQALRLAASQERQNNYLVDQLAPKLPVAAYTVPNPFTGVGGCGCCGGMYS